MKVPTLVGRKEDVASYWVEGVSNKTKFSKEAFKFIEYLSKPQTLQKLYSLQSKTRQFGVLYPRRDMATLLNSNTLVYPFIQQGDDAQSTIFASDTFDEAMNDNLNTYLGNAINTVVNQNSSADTAIETLANGVTQVLQQYAR